MSSLLIICGHYGVGKTNLSVNVAIESARSGKRTVLIDLDTVNPYFRSSDHRAVLEKDNVELVVPEFANTNVESLFVPHMDLTFDDGKFTIIDVGGDDAGATVLGRYSNTIKERGYEMWYVINKNRPMTSEAEDTAEMLRSIEKACRLEATGIVNNSHLKEYTTIDTIKDSAEYAEKVSRTTGLPIVRTTCPKGISGKEQNIIPLYPVDIYVRTPWDTEE